MKKLLIIFLLACSVQFARANSSDYILDENAIEASLNQAEDVTAKLILENNIAPADQATLFDLTGTKQAADKFQFRAAGSGEKSAIAAVLLDFFLGGLGIHRFYLGTKTLTGIGYILTLGGICGIVPLVDLVVMLVNFDDISPFVDNPKFFMWSGK